MGQEQVVLNEVVTEARLGQRAVADALHEGVLRVGPPVLGAGRLQAVEQPAAHASSMLRVAAGRRTVSPSSSGVITIWQPSREVLVRPRPEARRVGKECDARCRSLGSPVHEKTK